MRIVLVVALIVFGCLPACAGLIVGSDHYVVSLNPHRANITVVSTEELKYVGELPAPQGTTDIYHYKNRVFCHLPNSSILYFIDLPPKGKSISDFVLHLLNAPLLITHLSVHQRGMVIYDAGSQSYALYQDGTFSDPQLVQIPKSLQNPKVKLCGHLFMIWPSTASSVRGQNLILSAHKLFSFNSLTREMKQASGSVLFDIDDVQISDEYLIAFAHDKHHLLIFDNETLSLIYTLNFPKPVLTVHLENGLEEAAYFYEDGYAIMNHINNKTLKEETVEGLCASSLFPGYVIYAKPSIQGRWNISIQSIYDMPSYPIDVKWRPLEIISVRNQIFSKLLDTTALGYLKLPSY